MSKRAVFSLRIAGILARKGYEVIDKQPNFHDPRLYVYFFKKTPGLEQELEKELEKLRKEKQK